MAGEVASRTMAVKSEANTRQDTHRAGTGLPLTGLTCRSAGESIGETLSRGSDIIYLSALWGSYSETPHRACGARGVKITPWSWCCGSWPRQKSGRTQTGTSEIEKTNKLRAVVLCRAAQQRHTGGSAPAFAKMRTIAVVRRQGGQKLWDCDTRFSRRSALDVSRNRVY